MKKQFLKEAHRRNDKAFNPDYLEKLRDEPPRKHNWTGADSEMLRENGRRIRLREEQSRRNERQIDALLQDARCWFFRYGKWLYQHTTKLSHFATINGNHASPDDPEVERAFNRCRKSWDRDFPRVLTAIKHAKFVRQKFGWDQMVPLQLPSSLIADEVSENMPRSFRPTRQSKQRVDSSKSKNRSSNDRN